MTDVKPALTEEEWEEQRIRKPWMNGLETGWFLDKNSRLICYDLVDEEGTTRCHRLSLEHQYALAALCLHGQEFGFTWEDVDLLRKKAGTLDENLSYQGAHNGGYRYRDLANRIAALLPPKE